MVESFSKTFFFPNEEEIKKIAIFRNAKKVYCTYHKNEKLSKVGKQRICKVCRKEKAKKVYDEKQKIKFDFFK